MSLETTIEATNRNRASIKTKRNQRRFLIVLFCHRGMYPGRQSVYESDVFNKELLLGLGKHSTTQFRSSFSDDVGEVGP